MATLVKTPSDTRKALARKTGWPTMAKTFRTKSDAEDWSRRTEDEMVRGAYTQRSGSECMTLEAALNYPNPEAHHSAWRNLESQEVHRAPGQILTGCALR